MLTEHDGENTRMKDEDLDEEMGRLECLGLIDGGLVCVWMTSAWVWLPCAAPVLLRPTFRPAVSGQRGARGGVRGGVRGGGRGSPSLSWHHPPSSCPDGGKLHNPRTKAPLLAVVNMSLLLH